MHFKDPKMSRDWILRLDVFLHLTELDPQTDPNAAFRDALYHLYNLDAQSMKKPYEESKYNLVADITATKAISY